MPKISIIMPVYNTEKYLQKCLDSIINQTLDDIEVLCINDGSKDNSLNILNEYAAKDSRIRVFSQKNSGPSAARNFALEKVNGEYIVFVDSDDWIDKTMCEKIYKKAIETDADMVMFSNYEVYSDRTVENQNIIKLNSCIPKESFYFDDEIDKFFDNYKASTAGKLYRTSFLKDNDIKFNASLRNGEDSLFLCSVCLCNPKISIEPEFFYYYNRVVESSLCIRDDILVGVHEALKCIKAKYSKSKLKNKEEFFHHFIRMKTRMYLYFWNSQFTVTNKKKYYKYIKYVYNLYKKYPHNDDNIFKYLEDSIKNYQKKFFTLLFEPIYRFEKRSTRLVWYLFGRQVLNISRLRFYRKKYELFYFLNLIKLRIISKFRKIRVGFYVIEVQKWSAEFLIEYLKKDKHFEPFILQSYFNHPVGEYNPEEYYNEVKEFYKKTGLPIYDTFDPKEYSFKELKEFKPDIIFYQQPWSIPYIQGINKNFMNSLTCYIPYCFYSMDSYMNYIPYFHNLLWKYFVETPTHKKEYKKLYSANNCVPVGSTKLDYYHHIDETKAQECWKTTDKKRIIYAPHHSFDYGDQECATFVQNGKFILELAKSHPEIEWVFRPHAALRIKLLKLSIMTLDEINEYFSEWEKVGRISTERDYYGMFLTSDLLITDCISFLSEYAPTLKPVFHLRNPRQTEEFNETVKKIIETYYQIYTNEELEATFKRVILNDDDYLKEKRQNNKALLPMDKMASENIYNYLKKELWIK